MKTRFTALALSDLKAIAYWVAADRPNTARKLIQGLRAASMGLSKQPYAYTFVEGREDKGVRRAPYSRYLICYRVDEDEVLVLRILDGARDIPSLL